MQARQIASEGLEPSDIYYSDVQAVDLSIFQQVNAKYRQLLGNGSI
jgi:hypothetical protein